MGITSRNIGKLVVRNQLFGSKPGRVPFPTDGNPASNDEWSRMGCTPEERCFFHTLHFVFGIYILLGYLVNPHENTKKKYKM